MVVPNDHLVLLVREHHHDEVGSIHHLDQFHRLAQILDLLLYFVRGTVVLDNLESLGCCDSEELLSLVDLDLSDRRSVCGYRLLS